MPPGVGYPPQSMPPQQMPAPSMGGGGGIPPELEPLIALATQILGHPPTSPEELIQALAMLQSMGGGTPQGGGAMPGAANGNAALMAAMGGGL